MPLVINLDEVDANQLAARRAINDAVEKATEAQVQWHQAPSVEEYRRWRREGLNGFPKPVLNPEAKTITIPSSHGDHKIPLRIIPTEGKIKGVYLHYHGGGMVVGSASSQDGLLTKIAHGTGLVVVSVTYRLAPEHVFPAALEDAVDAALFALSPEGESTLGGRLRIISGESAGGYLTMVVTLQLRARGIDVREKLDAIVPVYGVFDYTYTPSMLSHKRRIVMGLQDAKNFLETAMPLDKFPYSMRNRPEISPLYDDLSALPPALFLCGTADPLLDDSVFMANKYYLAGNKAELKLVQEGFHGFTLFPSGDMGDEAIKASIDFINRSLKVN